MTAKPAGSGEAPDLGVVQHTHAGLKPDRVGGAGSVSAFSVAGDGTESTRSPG